MSDRTITSIPGLIDAGLLSVDSPAAIEQLAAKYAVAITPAVAKNIDIADPADPLAKQFVPSLNELVTHPAETPDPISDEPFSPVKGIVHRYPDRALLKVVNICPVYCRFCFRREMVGPSQGVGLSASEIDTALTYIANTPAISEIIFTGGDPFVLSPRRLADLTSKMSSIPSIRKIRWHTRVPMVMPEKVDTNLVEALSAPGRAVRVAIHANHPNEFTDQAMEACQALESAGFELLSQSVLLKGINDCSSTIAALMMKYSEAGARPYYLHHGDLAPGTSHFRTTIADGMSLMRELAEAVPDTMHPKYILDVPGGSGKVELNTHNCHQQPDGSYLIGHHPDKQFRYVDAV
ncbi:MAG: lysine-2,3-aminomutase-like protein [Pseudomonadota bacterium]